MATKSQSQSPANSAAWLVGTKVKPLKVGPIPYTAPNAGEIVIRNRAIAINPVDRMKQEMGDMLYGWVEYPCVQGVDVAGEVVEVGANVTRFRVGDRVLSAALGMEKEINKPSRAGFQLYPVLLEQVVTKIPDSMSFEQAAAMPLAFMTAGCGLFQDDQLALKHPSLSPTPTGQTLLVWGASTSVGCNAVQLGVAAGYEVIGVCGSRNFDMVRKLGASQVYDYKSKTVVSDVTAAFKDRISAGCISCGNGGPEACLEIFKQAKGSKKIAFAAFPLPNPMPTGTFWLLKFGWHMTKFFASFMFWSTLRGIKQSSIWGGKPAFNGLAKYLFEGFLEQALVEGKYVSAPQVKVTGHGLEQVQKAYDELGKGVSATKLVVTV